MTAEQAEALRRLAAVRQRSQAALMRDAIDALTADVELTRRIERARRAVGAFRSGTTQTSVDHDAALVEAYRT